MLQRYRCKSCKRTFNEYTKTPLFDANIDALDWLAIHHWWSREPRDRPSLRHMAKVLHLSPETVRLWILRQRRTDSWGASRHVPLRDILGTTPHAFVSIRMKGRHSDWLEGKFDRLVVTAAFR